MPHEIASVLRCSLCSHMIAGPAGLVIGPGQANRVGQFMESLTEHLLKAHPNEFEVLQQKALEFFGLNCLMQYTTQDEAIRYQRNWLRWQIHQVTLNARFNDETLRTKSAEFAGALVDEVISGLLDAFGVEGQAPIRREAAQRAGVNIKAAIGGKVLELVTMIRDELQEPAEPQPPASVRVLKVS
jgi:hypothetical protein